MVDHQPMGTLQRALVSERFLGVDVGEFGNSYFLFKTTLHMKPVYFMLLCA